MAASVATNGFALLAGEAGRLGALGHRFCSTIHQLLSDGRDRA